MPSLYITMGLLSVFLYIILQRIDTEILSGVEDTYLVNFEEISKDGPGI